YLALVGACVDVPAVEPANTHARAMTRRTSMARRRRFAGYAFVAPVFLFLCVVIVFPLGHAFWTSLHRVRGLTSTFVGLDNYERVLSDSTFWNSLGISVAFTGLSVLL